MTITLENVRLGDTVRLTNGDEFAVKSKVVSYHDKDGDHEGPFVSADRGFGERFLLTDIAEIVARNPRVCACGEGITSTRDDVDFCEMCFYRGVPYDRAHSDLIDTLSALVGVDTVDIWHTGGGCFLLAVTLTDGRLFTCTGDQDAVLPDPVTGQWWAFEYPNEDAYDNQDDVDPDHQHEHLTETALVDLIRQTV